MPPTWEWTNELTLKFLKHLSKEKALWDLNDPRNKDKYKVNEAWDRISTAMGMPVDELKMKKTSLMASWRPLVKKKLASMESATHEDDIYQPSWFAYDLMEGFLGKLYGIEQTIKPEYEHEEVVELEIPPSPSDQSDVSSPPSVKSKSVSESLSSDKKKVKKNEKDYSKAPKNSRQASDPLHQVSKAKAQSRCLRTQEDEEDECVLYTKLLEKKLRRYPPRMRDRIMHKIDGLLLDNPYPETPNCSTSVSQQVPYQCYRNSPPSPVYVTTLHNTQADVSSVRNEPQKSIDIQTDMTYVDMNSSPRNSTPKNN